MRDSEAADHRTPARWRHIKRGTLYTEIGRAELQARQAVTEGAALLIGRDDHGRLFARPIDADTDRQFHQAHPIVADIGRAELQAQRPLAGGITLVIYQGEDGKLWARHDSEFLDGRFEPAQP